MTRRNLVELFLACVVAIVGVAFAPVAEAPCVLVDRGSVIVRSYPAGIGNVTYDATGRHWIGVLGRSNPDLPVHGVLELVPGGIDSCEGQGVAGCETYVEDLAAYPQHICHVGKAFTN